MYADKAGANLDEFINKLAETVEVSHDPGKEKNGAYRQLF